MSKQLVSLSQQKQKPSFKKFDTISLFIPFFGDNEPTILSHKRQTKAIKNEIAHQQANPHAKAKFGKNNRPAIIIGQGKNPYNTNDPNDYIVIAEFRSADKARPDDPDRVLLEDWGPNDANLHHRSYATIGRENLIYVSKTLAHTITPLGHLSEKDIATYSQAYFEHEMVNSKDQELHQEESDKALSDEELLQKLDKSMESVETSSTKDLSPDF